VGAGVGAGGVRDVVSVGRVLAAACAAVSACLLAACAHAPAPAVPSAVAPSAVAPSAIAPTSAPAVGASRPDHVVIVMLENKNEGDVLREGPYLASLTASGAVLTDMHAETHPSQPNYLALFSGSLQGVGNDSCPHTFSGTNLGRQFVDAGLGFAGYSEGLPSLGFTGCTSGRYARKHAPWVDFSNLSSSTNKPFTAFPTDFTQLPALSFVIPDLCNDMHDCSVATGDNWLRTRLKPFADWAKTHNSLLVVDFDEDDFTTTNRIPTVFYGQHVRTGTYPERITHYSVLRTVEDMFNLSHIGSAASANTIADSWQ
jgi:phosphatidylinositol-3-phosphatase